MRCQAAPAISIGDTLVTVGGKNVYGLSLTTLRLLSIHESLRCDLCMSAYRAGLMKMVLDGNAQDHRSRPRWFHREARIPVRTRRPSRVHAAQDHR